MRTRLTAMLGIAAAAGVNIDQLLPAERPVRDPTPEDALALQRAELKRQRKAARRVGKGAGK